jgi:hypothetical protein
MSNTPVESNLLTCWKVVACDQEEYKGLCQCEYQILEETCVFVRMSASCDSNSIQCS